MKKEKPTLKHLVTKNNKNNYISYLKKGKRKKKKRKFFPAQ